MKDSIHPLAARLHPRGEETHLSREIVRTSQLLINRFSRAVGIPASRLVVMRELANAPPVGIGIVSIARHLGINAAAVTRLVKDMEKEGLVSRRADNKDARRSYVRLSAKGIRTLTQAHAQALKFEQSVSSAITHDEMEVAVKVLTVLRTFIERLR